MKVKRNAFSIPYSLLLFPFPLQVRDIHIYDELFSVENGLLTPTFKGKRPALKTFFASQLADMYTNLQ